MSSATNQQEVAHSPFLQKRVRETQNALLRLVWHGVMQGRALDPADGNRWAQAYGTEFPKKTQKRNGIFSGLSLVI